MFCNMGAHEKGIPFLSKADQIYRLVKDVCTKDKQKGFNKSLVNDLDQYLLNQVTQSQSKKATGLP